MRVFPSKSISKYDPHSFVKEIISDLIEQILSFRKNQISNLFKEIQLEMEKELSVLKQNGSETWSC